MNPVADGSAPQKNVNHAIAELTLPFLQTGGLAIIYKKGDIQQELTQAYRLFTLALAGAPELPAMNQLRERASLPVAAKWRLAAAYQLAGQPEAARALASGTPVGVEPYRELAGTHGSDLRDRAMVLEAVVLMNLAGHVGPLVKGLSEALSKNEWLSTQETAYALLALSKAVSDPKGEARSAYSLEWNGGAATAVTSASPIVERWLEVGKATLPKLVVRNTGTATLYPGERSHRGHAALDHGGDASSK